VLIAGLFIVLTVDQLPVILDLKANTRAVAEAAPVGIL
jgi:hypothetical protein